MTSSIREEYEKAFSEYVDTLGARAFSRGRQGLMILLKALGVNEGDKVGVCGYTCIAVVEAIKLCGAKPVYFDVDEHLCIEPQEILRQKVGYLKVVILQHTFGVPGRLGQLLSGCDKIGAKVVEDCAHSLGCSWKGEPLGKFGEGAIYSFELGKPYTTVQGGILTVNSKELLDEVDRQIEVLALPASTLSELLLECDRRICPIMNRSKLRRYLRYMYWKPRGIKLLKGPSMVAREFRLTHGYVRLLGEMTARAGLRQLEVWPKLKQTRRENTEMIEEHFRKAGLALWPRPDKAEVTMMRYPVSTGNKAGVLKQGSRQNLDIAGLFMTPVHPLQGDDLAKVDYQSGMCPKSESMLRQLVYLPTGLTFNKQNLEAMMKIICNNYT